MNCPKRKATGSFLHLVITLFPERISEETHKISPENLSGKVVRFLLDKPNQLPFKYRNIINTGAVNVLFAERLIFMGGNVPHTRYGPPRNLLMSIFQFRREVLYQFADVDKRHTDGSGGAFVAKEILRRNAFEQVPGDGDFRKNFLDDLAVAIVHSTRTTFPG